jgi:hypothetical protein
MPQRTRCVERLRDHIKRPGFRCVAAVQTSLLAAHWRVRTTRPGVRPGVARWQPTDTIVGYAYGYTSGAGDHFGDTVRAALGPESAAFWLADCFELVELVVMPWAYGPGMADRLHDALLSAAPHRTALRCIPATAMPTIQLYQKRGWQLLNDTFANSWDEQPCVLLGRQFR